MIRNSKQNWAVGQVVKVGFLTLLVEATIKTPGDFLPDAYALRGDHDRFYRFVPYNGLTRCRDLAEVVAA